MATVKEHLAEMHKAMAARDQADAEDHRSIAEYHHKAGKLGLASSHKKIADRCEKSAEEHLACCETIKAAHEADLSKLVPDNFRGILPSDVPTFGIRAVSRPGGPEMPTAFDKAAVPPQFRHLISNEEL